MRIIISWKTINSIWAWIGDLIWRLRWMMREISGRRGRWKRDLIRINWLWIIILIGVLMLWRRVMIYNIDLITHIGLISHIVWSCGWRCGREVGFTIFGWVSLVLRTALSFIIQIMTYFRSLSQLSQPVSILTFTAQLSTFSFFKCNT
jgi:hypothetical protein